MELSKLQLTAEEADLFLSRIGKDRQWFADQLRASKGTVNNWFSKGELPEWAQASGRRLINEFHQKQTSTEELLFSIDEIHQIYKAMKVTGEVSVEEWIKNSLKNALSTETESKSED